MSDPENEDQQEPKIIVDTDWKEQVAKEKEAASEAAAAEPDASATEIDHEAGSPVAEQPADQELPPPPPATFDVLISMLFTQALAMLGQMPDPGTGKATVNKPYAKHHIDTLEMLQEKTSGNLSDDETKMLSEALHALRMAYVNTRE